MTTASERIQQVASKKQSDWIKDAKQREANKSWRKNSFKVATLILREIRRQKPINGMTQAKLAELMGVSAQYINKVVKGKENFTFETISKIEAVLGITLLEIPVAKASTTMDISNEVQEVNNKVERNKAVSVGCKIIELETEYIMPTGTNG